MIPTKGLDSFLLESLLSIQKAKASIFIENRCQIEIKVIVDRVSKSQDRSVFRKINRIYETNSSAEILFVSAVSWSGPGGCRNLGIDLSDAEWLWFLDSGDLITHNSLQVITDNLLDAVNILEFGLISESDRSKARLMAKKLIEKCSTPSCHTRNILNTADKLDQFLKNKNMFSVNKIVSSKFISDHRFEPKVFYEDVGFWPKIFRGASVKSIYDKIYIYVQDSCSITNCISIRNEVDFRFALSCISACDIRIPRKLFIDYLKIRVRSLGFSAIKNWDEVRDFQNRVANYSFGDNLLAAMPQVFMFVYWIYREIYSCRK